MKYLTESNLKNYLKEIKPKQTFIHDKAVPGAKNKRTRPDFRCDKLKLIIEFDGSSHYCNVDRIFKDKEKNIDYKKLGYKIFRIPYFIQMSSNLLKLIFQENIIFPQVYPNGFIDKGAVLPANFCNKGIEIFKKNLKQFSYCKKEIINSLKIKIQEKNNIELVLPPQLYYLNK